LETMGCEVGWCVAAILPGSRLTAASSEPVTGMGGSEEISIAGGGGAVGAFTGGGWDKAGAGLACGSGIPWISIIRR